MFTSMEMSVESIRREEVRREVETNRLAGSLRASLAGRKGLIRFARSLRTKEVGPESARA
jgi:hypothetical protein